MKTRILLWWLLCFGAGFVGIFVFYNALLELESQKNLTVFTVKTLIAFVLAVGTPALFGRWNLEELHKANAKLTGLYAESSLSKKHIHLLERDQNIYRTLMRGKHGVVVIANTDVERIFSEPINIRIGGIVKDKAGDVSIYCIPPKTNFTVQMEDEREKLLAKTEFTSMIGEMIWIGYEDWLLKNLPYGVNANDVVKVGAGMAYVIYRMPVLIPLEEVSSN